MRVAVHAGQLLQPVPGGIGRYVAALLAELPGAGAEVVAFGAGGRPGSVPARVPWIDLGPPRGTARYELWHRLRRPRVRIDADVFHAPSLAVPPVVPAPLVVTVHDVAFLRLPHAATRRGVAFHTRGLELARAEAAVVLCPSEFTRTELLAEGFDPDRVLVVPHGVDPPGPRDPADIDLTLQRCGVRPPYVLHVGTIEPRKDVPTLVAAVERLRSRHPDLTLVLAGPRGWGSVTGVDRPCVRLLGDLPWPVVDALYRRAAACCVASRYEGFGLPVLEAFARGTPVVAADNSALREVTGDAGVPFPTGDADALADALGGVLDDGARRAELRRRGLARAAAATWRSAAAAHLRAYARAAGRGPAA
ncbi:MAG: glycosyl transferase [Acidimicrobiia bacterium]|nr:MAG: glycosyl transferase [Acidimicrobiia bacterium]